MNNGEAYAEGYQAGHSSAIYCLVNHEARREAAYHSGCSCRAPRMCEECLTRAAYNAEMGARDFEPWQAIVAEINETKSPVRRDTLWAAYDKGLARGIYVGVTERMKLYEATKTTAGRR